MASPQQHKEMLAAVNLLSMINKHNLKTFSTKTRQALIFNILNDTIQIVPYDRAVLWSFEGDSPKLLGVSGQSNFNAKGSLAKKWETLIKDLVDPNKSQILSEDSFSKVKTEWIDISTNSPKPIILWIPIFTDEKLHLGLWLERWNGRNWNPQEIEILNFVTQAYGIAWERFLPKYSAKILKNRKFLIPALAIAFIILAWRTPLRVVAPCEVVPKDPIVITAPLEDIIAEVDVKPGQHVNAGDPLFEYDKRVALENLKASEEEVEVAQRDLNRAKTLAINDQKSLSEIAVLAAKLKKEQIGLELAKYKASLLTVKSPANGIVVLDDPEEWRGKPVHVGERIMMVTDPNKTKVRIWIPESDNIPLDPQKNINVILDPNPARTLEAKLLYVANASTVNDKHVPSFVAEADWIEEPTDVKMGVKGTAVLYGDNVSVFYLLLRRPWSYFRNLFGI